MQPYGEAWASLVALGVKNLLAIARDPRDASSIPELERSLEEAMAIHLSILAWRIPWTEGASYRVAKGQT